MGWTYQLPKHFKYNKSGFQCIDCKAECDALYSNGGKWRVLKSTMVGTTYYAAVDNGKEVFCGVALTSVKKNEFGVVHVYFPIVLVKHLFDGYVLRNRCPFQCAPTKLCACQCFHTLDRIPLF